ncbi:hypothetical protein B0F90DRAFT_1925625 [Multifurca ochricompacta]|uniref:THO1-MOS11 C-terminal domain-containing protein n=1 Tax=Multifurca ochricompacta TaxID=376703 RepID=A0AAD4M3U0_9AGAM|nr:hypothetical protein B0F90DRAFT_1925625 [Multifurca ochricompacta]
MELKLKSLKVADLKDICTRANLATTTRSTKADLITKILASQAAVDAYKAKYQQNGNSAPSLKSTALSNNDDMSAPPEEVDWTPEEPSVALPPPATPAAFTKSNSPTKLPPTSSTPQSKVVPSKATTTASEATKVSAPLPTTPADEELEKRKARAARFGIALVEPAKPKINSVPLPTTRTAGPVKPVDVSRKLSPTRPLNDTLQLQDLEKLKARSERFITGKHAQAEAKSTSAVSSKKRSSAVVEEIDTEEQERRRKRAERFGISMVVCSDFCIQLSVAGIHASLAQGAKA